MPRSHPAHHRCPETAEIARDLRRSMTDAECRFWYYVRAGRFGGWKFRRQVPLGRYVVDFLCEAARLVVEIDGGQHQDRAAADAERTYWLEAQGYRVVRYWNNDVLANISGVLEDLSGQLQPSPRPSPTPVLGHEGEGEQHG